MKKNVITTAILLASASSFANEVAKLDEITVYSAYATPVNQDKTASSVTVLTEKDFAERNATYVSDVLKTVPGAVLGTSGGRGAISSLFLRGANSAHSTVIIDGVKMNPADTNFSFGGLSLSNVERIEILRGEQSALWGSDSMGGVIYITTKSGLYKDKAFNVDFDLGTGSNRTRDGSVTVSGHNNGFYYALNGNTHRTSNISVASKERFNYTDNNGNSVRTGGAVERDGFHRDATSLRLGYDDAKQGVDFLASHYSQSYHNDGITKGGTATSGFSAAENLAENRIRTKETLFKLGGYLGSDQDLLKHKASVSHIKHDNDVFNGSSSNNKDWKKLSANYQLDINFDREGSITQGVSILGDYQRISFDSSNFANKIYAQTPPYALLSTTYLGEKRLSEKSIATEYRLFTDEDHSLSLSGRFTDNSKYQDAWTGRLSAGYRLSPNFRLHGSVGSAIQNPNITEYYGWDSNYVGNAKLKPAKSVGGDIGLLIETANKAHSLDVTYFARNVKDYISSKIIGQDASYNDIYQAINANGTTQIRGVELAYQGKITSDLTAYANYTYTDINLDKKNDAYGTNYVRRPQHLANAGLNYQITEKLGTNLNVSYTGSRSDMYYGPYNPITRKSYQSEVKMPSYTLVNLGANYQLTKNVNVYANLNNLFNKKYENVLGYGQDGRNVYVGLRGSF